MLKDEFEHLMNMFREGSEGKISLHVLFTESLAFFQRLKDEFEQASPQEKQELMEMMTRMNKQIMEESKRIMKISGLNEEQLLSFSDNPSNFTPEQWKEFQESKSQIYKAGMDLFKEVHKQMPQLTPKVHSVQPLEKKEHPGTKKSRKSDWKRS